jgi:quinoprotein glucose dehydrogenase
MRAAAYGVLARLDKDAFKKRLTTHHSTDSQAIYLTLQGMKNHGFNDYLKTHLKALSNDSHPPDSEIELLEAAQASNDKEVKKAAADYEKKIKESKDPLALYHGALYGGDPDNGRKLIIEQSVGQCIICHKFEGKGGIVAPDLSQIAMEKRATREYLLESLIVPSAQVVPGFGNMTVTLKNGETLMGSLLKEDDKHLELKFVDGTSKTIPLKDMSNRKPAISLMPPMVGMLKPAQIRDIIAYLATLNKPIKPAKDDH